MIVYLKILGPVRIIPTLGHKVMSALGYHRLSILDLDTRSNQSMTRDGMTLVFNG